MAGGVSPDMIATQVAHGRLIHLRKGVFVSAEAWPREPADQHLVRAHAEQVANPDAVISHQSAAVLWGLPSPGFHDWHESTVSLTLPAACRGSRHRGAAWHIASLPAAHVTRDRDGYLATSLARTAIDLAAGLSLPEALVILDAAARQLVVSFVTDVRRGDYVNPRLIRAAREGLSEAVGRRWRRQLMSAIAYVQPCRESPAESLAAGHLHLSGLPIPEFQAKIVTSRGTFYPDCYWREAGLVGECDGKVKYAGRDDIVAEKRREQVLRDEGHRFVRWLGGEIMSTPSEVMSRIARALGV
jgi:very-short-patch-repair endonuclease